MSRKVLLRLLFLLFLINLQLNPYLTPPVAVSQLRQTTIIGDYGDAPQGVHAGYSGFFQEILAGFPSAYDETEARYFIVHRLPRERVFLGDTATDETDARVVDWDLDDGVLPIYFLPCTQNVLEVEVTVPEKAPAGPIYLNALFDWNHDGHWSGYDQCPPQENFPEGKAPEWAIQNLRLDQPPYNIGPGFHGAIKTPPILPGASPGELWLRVTVTVDPVDEEKFPPVSRGGQGWDGRGDFLYGETEDYYTYCFGFCPAELPAWPAGPEVRPPDWNPTPPDLDPPPEEEEVPEVCDGLDNDGDGLIDEGLPDADGDGICDGIDICLGGDDAVDTDGDLIPDDCDNCPLVVNIDQTDSDRDGIGNACDNCPGVFNPGQGNADRDGLGDACDGCPDDSDKVEPGLCGCGVADTDSDGDGTPDCNDLCPSDLGKTEPGVCGCGVVDMDSDSDGMPDCQDSCPADPNKTNPGQCGCGTADTDTDGDGTPDCHDNCPTDPAKTQPGVCGCNIADIDSDQDGTPDCHDNCPTMPNPGQLDSDHDGIGDACECLGVTCDDGLSCTVDTCDEATGSCIYTPDSSRCPGSGWYDTGNARWIELDACQEKGQKEQEYRSYYCDLAADCQYTIAGTQWADTGDIQPKPDGTSCEDGLFCNGEETCQSGVCSAGIPPAIDDGIACTVDACDEATNTIAHIPDDSRCDDGLYCNGVEYCDATLGCQAGTPVVCDDGVACTDDSCDEASDNCAYRANNGNCPDSGWFDTGNIRWADEGLCIEKEQEEQEYRAYYCDLNAGCQYTITGTRWVETGVTRAKPDGTSCDDGLWCNGSETCQSGVCQPGTPVVCDDGNPCTADSCNEAADACVYDAAAMDGTPCDDGNACTIADHCDNGACVGGGSLSCEDGNVCTDDLCDPQSGCYYENNTAPCDDGLFCTVGDTCSGGLCSGTPRDCSGLNGQCTIGICSEDQQACMMEPANEGGSCDDGLWCTVDDTCQSGNCQGTPRDCDDGLACSIDSCSEASRRCTHDYSGCRGCISLQKTGPATAQIGDTITYNFTVTNCGELVLDGAQVSDPLLGGQIWSGSLQPGQAVTFTKSYTVQPGDPDPLVNTATAVGHPRLPDGSYLPDVTATASWTVDLEGGGWDKSSLAFISEGWNCNGGGTAFATVKNTGEAMQGPTTWELLYAESGNPKNGVVVASGVIPPLAGGQTYTMSFPVTASGNYMFQAYQRPGHPGQGELFSGQITFNKSSCP